MDSLEGVKTVLGIETSCDETGVAIYREGNGILANALYSQIAKHAPYGGVVPEIASRDHIRKLVPLIHQVLEEAELKHTDIDGVAYTAGPGLIGALMVGACLGRSLGFAWQVPTIGVHHLEAHLLAPMLEVEKPSYPFLALLVSGGHTMLVETTAPGQYELLGDTLDDAVGEAFDKTAKLLGLGYPGGPALAKLAEDGQPTDLVFPRPMTQKAGLDFSFSGLKTHALKVIQEAKYSKADIAYAFQEAVVDTMAIKMRRAIKQTGIRQLVVAGGVSANVALRAKLYDTLAELDSEVFYPSMAYCTDNGAMVAYAGFLRLAAGQQEDLSVKPRARWSLTELLPI